MKHDQGLALVAEWLFRRWETMPLARRRALTGIAPMTEAKAVMIAENEDPIDVWLRRCVESEHPEPDALPDVVSVDSVIERMLQAQRAGWFNGARVNANPVSVGRRLAKIGAVKAYGGNALIVRGRRTRVWIIRNNDLYAGLASSDLSRVCDVVGATPQTVVGH